MYLQASNLFMFVAGKSDLIKRKIISSTPKESLSDLARNPAASHPFADREQEVPDGPTPRSQSDPAAALPTGPERKLCCDNRLSRQSQAGLSPR